MTPQDIALVRSSFARIEPHAALFAEAFYHQLFSQNPNIAMMFSGDMEEQAERLGAMLGTVVSGIDRLDDLGPALRNLGMRHVHYGVKPGDYVIFGRSLLWTLERFLDEAFTPEVRMAWVRFYDVLSMTMLGTREWRRTALPNRNSSWALAEEESELQPG